MWKHLKGQQQTTPHQLHTELSHINVMVDIPSMTHAEPQIAQRRGAPTLPWLLPDKAAQQGNNTFNITPCLYTDGVTAFTHHPFLRFG